MSEYTIPLGDDTKAYNALDTFTQGYIEAMFFTECHADNPELEDATFSDLAPETIAACVAQCARFQEKYASLLVEAYGRGYSEEQAGHDFWFTQNGHGVGFWDREELSAGELGERLSAACRRNEVYVYRGDDGLVYLG